MPLGWECRSRLIKQRPLKPTEPRRPGKTSTLPGPTDYALPEILGAAGYSKIKRQPAYTFGIRTHVPIKPIRKRNAPLFDITGFVEKGGRYRIPGGIVSAQFETPGAKMKVPGPGAHTPGLDSRYKRAAAYTLGPAARAQYEDRDQWTPPPNIYWPPIPGKKPPAYTMGYQVKPLPPSSVPGPGNYDPKFCNVIKNGPAYTFLGHQQRLTPKMSPAPNAYCENMFNVAKPSIPRQSFGIRHTPYLGQQTPYLKTSDLDLRIRQY